MNPQFVQIPCGKCGATVWISPAAGVGYCPSCHSPNSIPAGGVPNASAGAPQGQAPGGFPGAPNAPQQYGGAAQAPAGMQGNVMAFKAPKGPPVGLIIAGVVAVAVLSIGFGFVKSYIFKPKGTAAVKDLGIDPKKADPDKMIDKTRELARKWQSDAEFHGINITGINPDGTIDLTDHNAIVEFYSPSRVTSSNPTGRRDAVKKFNFVGDTINYKDIFDATNQWKGVEPTPHECTVAKVVEIAKDAGFKSGTAQIVLDPTSAMAWHLIMSKPSVSKWYDLESCEELTPSFGKDDDD